MGMADQTEQTDPTDQYEQPANTDEQQAHPLSLIHI